MLNKQTLHMQNTQIRNIRIFIWAFFLPQALLRTLTFLSTADEPSLRERVIAITVNGISETRSCNVLVSIIPVNDNTPVVDLNGPLLSGINHSVVLPYNFFSSASVWISSRDATVSDFDQDSRIESLDIRLDRGASEDVIYLSSNIGCAGSAQVCQLR